MHPYHLRVGVYWINDWTNDLTDLAPKEGHAAGAQRIDALMDSQGARTGTGTQDRCRIRKERWLLMEGKFDR